MDPGTNDILTDPSTYNVLLLLQTTLRIPMVEEWVANPGESLLGTHPQITLKFSAVSFNKSGTTSRQWNMSSNRELQEVISR
jgi:hypothetical protein